VRDKCPNGHAYIEVGYWIDKHGWRRCAICVESRRSRRNERKREYERIRYRRRVLGRDDSPKEGLE
jgi:hypothetical protein